jgi:hypothetical protein
MATLQGKAVKNTYRQVLQIGANNVGVSGSLQPVQDGGGVNTSLSLSTTAATITGTLTINGDLIITGGGIQIQDLIDDTVATLIQNGTGITWAYNDTLRTLTPTITIATADGGVQGDFVQFNTNAGEASAVGKLKWNTADGTLDLGLMGGQVTLQIGQEQVARVLNNSGSILQEAAYQVVKVASAQGQRLAVTLAQANNDANSADTLGLVTENIANNQEGFVTTSGLVRNIDTTGDLQLEDWNDGDVLYLSPTTPGAITKVKPVAPQHTVIVGFVVYAHKTQGKIFVKVDNGYELDELHNVKITNVANDNILQYNSSLAVWENVAGTTTNIAEGTNLYYTQGRFDSAFAAKSTTNLAEGTNLYFTTARGDANFATNFATKTTTNLPEGTNLYYTDARSRAALAVTAGTGIAYNSTTGVFNLGSIPNASLTNSSVTVNGLSLALGASITLTTSNIAEGTNLYWTDARFDSRFGTKSTTDLAEGTNLYYTQARFNTAFDAKTTTDLDEGTNLYYTDARSRAAFSENAVGLDYSSGSGVLSLTSGYAIPTTVKLGEYDIAYNRSIVSAAVTGTSTKTLSLTQQDANVITASWTDQGITTINGTANQIAATTVGNTTTLAFTNDVTMPNNLVVSGNLTINGTATYVNTQSISAKDPLFEVANDNNTTDAVDIGYYGRYYDAAQTRVEFTGLFRDASDAGKFKMFTGLTVEPTNVVDTTGTGYTVGTLVANFEGNLAGTANAANALTTARTIAASGDATWSVSFDGSANTTAALTLANTGVTATTYGTTTAVPTIAVDGKGRITSASNTNIAFPVTTVNGASGTVVLTTSVIAEGTNQYFTTGRAQSAISLTTSGTSGAATYSGGVFNIPTYIGGSGTINEIAFFSTTGVISSLTTATYPSLTELSYVKGVTSGIQTQLNAKQAALSGTGFVKISGTTISYDNSTYLTTSAASSTYLPLAGGTLTGALSGTTATFSGDIGIGAAPSAWATIKALEIYNGSIGASPNNNILYQFGNTFFDGSFKYIASDFAAQYRINDSGQHIWYTAPSGTAGTAATFTQRMSIAADGTKYFGNPTGSRFQMNASGENFYQYTNSYYIWGLYNDSNNLSIESLFSGAINFKTAAQSTSSVPTTGTTRMTITSGGNVLIGTTSDNGDKLQVSGGSTITGNTGVGTGSTSGIRLFVKGQDTSSSNYSIISYNSSNQELLLIRNDGAFQTGRATLSPYNNTTGGLANVVVSSDGSLLRSVASSERFKENITDWNASGLDTILALKPKTFTYKADYYKNPELKMLGLIAEEVAEVSPFLAEYENEDRSGQVENVRYATIVVPLIKAIQEQQAQIEELKALIAAK